MKTDHKTERDAKRYKDGQLITGHPETRREIIHQTLAALSLDSVVHICICQTEIFSYKTTPFVVISDAVRISMSIPFVFKPHSKYVKYPPAPTRDPAPPPVTTSAGAASSPHSPGGSDLGRPAPPCEPKPSPTNGFGASPLTPHVPAPSGTAESGAGAGPEGGYPMSQASSTGPGSPSLEFREEGMQGSLQNSFAIPGLDPPGPSTSEAPEAAAVAGGDLQPLFSPSTPDALPCRNPDESPEQQTSCSNPSTFSSSEYPPVPVPQTTPNASPSDGAPAPEYPTVPSPTKLMDANRPASLSLSETETPTPSHAVLSAALAEHRTANADPGLYPSMPVHASPNAQASQGLHCPSQPSTPSVVTHIVRTPAFNRQRSLAGGQLREVLGRPRSSAQDRMRERHPDLSLHRYVDGGVTCNYPLCIVPQHASLGIRLISNAQSTLVHRTQPLPVKGTRGLSNFGSALMQGYYFGSLFVENQRADSARTIYVNAGDIKGVDFKLDKTQQQV